MECKGGNHGGNTFTRMLSPRKWTTSDLTQPNAPISKDLCTGEQTKAGHKIHWDWIVPLWKVGSGRVVAWPFQLPPPRSSIHFHCWYIMFWWLNLSKLEGYLTCCCDTFFRSKTVAMWVNLHAFLSILSIRQGNGKNPITKLTKLYQIIRWRNNKTVYVIWMPFVFLIYWK